MNITITEGQLQEVKRLKLSLHHILYLQWAKEGKTVPITSPECKMLVGRYLLTPEGSITPTGEATWNQIENAVQSPLRQIKIQSIVSEEVLNSFRIFWNEFPSTAQFTYKGHLFTSERTLRQQESVALQKYAGIIASGVSPDTILKCLQVEVATRKEESWKHWKKENKMNSMSGIIPWLNQKKYEGYIGREMPVIEPIKKETEQYISI